MKEQNHIKAYLKALWEKPINLILVLLDIAGLGAIILIVVDDWIEAILVLVFLAIWAYCNYSIFRQQRTSIAELEDYITEIEALEANINVEVQGSVELGIAEHSIDEQGLPNKGVFQAILEFENTGQESGELVWELGRGETTLPRFCTLDPDNDGGFNVPLHKIEGRDRTQRWFSVPIRVVVQDPALFAQELNSREHYSVVIRYYTRRIGGPPSPKRLVIKGDLQRTRQKMRAYWEKLGYSNLARLVDAR